MKKILIIISLFFYLPILAEIKPGSIAGKITDKKSRQPLIGANIVIEGTSQGAATDSEGFFIIKGINPGSYNISVYYLGYKTLKRNNIIVNPTRTSVMDIELEESYLEGETIEVSGSFFEKPREAVVSTRSMNFEEIRRSPGDLVDIQRSVQALPAVVTGSDQINEIIIRGGYPGENLFLMDNIEIPNPNHFAIQGAGGGQINLLNSYMVKNIDFYAGAFSSRFGDKASSVMEINLRDGNRDKFRGEGSFGMAGAGVLVEGPLSSKSSFVFSARKSFLDWIITSLDLTAIPNYYSLQGKLTYDINKYNTLLFNAVYGSDNIKIEDVESAGIGRGGENIDTNNSQSIAGLTLRTLWTNSLFSNTTISAVRNNYFVDVYEKDELEQNNTVFITDAKETEYTLKSDFVYQLNKHFELNFGGNYKRIRFDYDNQLDADTLFYYQNNVKTDSIFRIYPSKIDDLDITSVKTAFYAQATWDFLKRFRITAGLRYHYFDYTRFSNISPRVGLSYSLSPKVTLNLAYGKHFQSPSYVELIGNPSNKNLESKYTDQYVFSYEHLFREDIKLVLETYYKEYRQVPVNKTLTTIDPFDFDDGRYLNLGTGRSRGFELFLQKKLTKSFSSILSYSYSKSEAKDPRTNKYYDWDYDYRNVFTFISGYKFSLIDKSWYQNMKKKWWFYSVFWLPVFAADEIELSAKFRYLGGRPYTPPTYYPELQEWVIDESQPLNTVRYPGYHRLDLRIDRRIIFDDWSFVIFFDINNIYNRDNIWGYQYDVDDNGNPEIKEILQYKTLPIGGFTIEF